MNTIINNLKHLRTLIEDTPDTVINLARFKTECGTHFCAIGLAACATHFQQQGLTLEPVKDSYWKQFQSFEPVLNGVYLLSQDGYQSLEPLFGPKAFDRLFDSREESYWDDEILDNPRLQDVNGYISDKQLAIARIDMQLQELAE